MDTGVPLLISEGFISEVNNYDRVALGYRESQFLLMIATNEQCAYDIYSDLNGGETNKGKARKLPYLIAGHGDSMSYKNVRKRIKRLEKLTLIKGVKEANGGRVKIIYKLTPHGIFQCFLSPPIGLSLSLIIKKYRDNLVLRTILFQYIRLETVQELMNIFGEWVLLEYLRKCCEQILAIVTEGKLQEEEFENQKNPGIAKWWPYHYSEKKKIQRMVIKYQVKTTNDLIKREINSLLNQIILSSIHSMYKDNFPSRLLTIDVQFIDLVKSVKNDFDKGCKNFLFNQCDI